MPLETVNGACLQCTFGLAPSSLIVLPVHRTMAGNQPAANITDHAPMVNIMPFGMCTSLANPTVASATSAALGVLTPMPCIPNTASPWAPGEPSILIDNQPALNNTSLCNCAWAGVISITMPGQTTVFVGPSGSGGAGGGGGGDDGAVCKADEPPPEPSFWDKAFSMAEGVVAGVAKGAVQMGKTAAVAEGAAAGAIVGSKLLQAIGTIKKNINPWSLSERLGDVVSAVPDVLKLISDKNIAPLIAEAVGRVTNQGTRDAVSNALGKLSGKIEAAGDAPGVLLGPVIDFATRTFQGRPLFSPGAIFDYSADILTGVIGIGVTGICTAAGSFIAPPLGTVAGVTAGIAANVALDHYVYKPIEKIAKNALGIPED